MTWGGNYAGMEMYSVNIVHLQPQILDPGKYNDNNAKITYGEGWQTATNRSFYNGDNHYSTNPGSYANFKFAGGSFNIVYTGASNRGLIDIYVDDSLAGTINQYSSSTTYQKTWSSSEYDPGEHTVRLEHDSGSMVDIDAAQINAPCLDLILSHTGSGSALVADPAKSESCQSLRKYNPGEVITLTAQPDSGWRVKNWTGTSNNASTAATNTVTMPASSHSASVNYVIVPGVDTYENGDTNITYTGNWTTWNDSRLSGGTGRYSNDTAASAELIFSGRQVSLLFTRYTSRGNIEITIDGGTPVLLNQYGSNLTFQNRWDSPLMDEGIHSIRLRHPGGTKYIDIDALIVSSPESDPPAAVTLNAATGSSTGQVDLSWIAPVTTGTPARLPSTSCAMRPAQLTLWPNGMPPPM